ncbi:MAG: hypothetical protein HC830_12365, partial [Bacteroidetes bacterium]|nr:hypothetical protein [Bacteroidota bacterium]
LSGDTAQLPPVGMSLSNAMSAGILSGYNLSVEEYELKELYVSRWIREYYPMQLLSGMLSPEERLFFRK